MSYQAKTERAKRLERFAETAMARLIGDRWMLRSEINVAEVVIIAWDFAVRMEDRRSEVLSSLAGLEPQDPNEPPTEEKGL